MVNQQSNQFLKECSIKKKNKFIAYLLLSLACVYIPGLQRLYLGYYKSGILFLCTMGIFGIGSMYDLFVLWHKVDEYNTQILNKSKTNINLEQITDISKKKEEECVIQNCKQYNYNLKNLDISSKWQWVLAVILFALTLMSGDWLLAITCLILPFLWI